MHQRGFVLKVLTFLIYSRLLAIFELNKDLWQWNWDETKLLKRKHFLSKQMLINSAVF